MVEHLNGRSLVLRWSEAPWDEAVLGYPVVQIEHIELLGEPVYARAEFRDFERRIAARGVGMVSCRLPHDRLRESMLLEDAQFRFVEMAYRPERKLTVDDAWAHDLTVRRARTEDLITVRQIASTAFRNERFYVDPRLSPEISDRRYGNWAGSSFEHPRQELYVLSEADNLISFFVIERQESGVCYWHLNAVAAVFHGHGYGQRCWQAMLQWAREQGCTSVASSIVARNYRVLNLYAKLGFRFTAPNMTFHWIAT